MDGPYLCAEHIILRKIRVYTDNFGARKGDNCLAACMIL